MPSTGNSRLRGWNHRARPGNRRRLRGSARDRRTRRHEILSSASVILAGVLVVVGFAYIATRALHNDTSPAALPTTPADGGTTAPALNQDLIPLQSASPSPSASPASPQPDPGALAVTSAAVPGLVNLSAEGKIDWVHWGAGGTYSLERDKAGGFAILEGAPTAPRFDDDNSPQVYAWTGGDPIAAASGTATGIHTCGKGNGFTISAPAGNGIRVLRLYVGAMNAEGRLDAKLSTGKATATATLDQHGRSLHTAVLTVTYRAPKDGRLQLTWSTAQAYGQGCGGVALEAATLR